MSINKLRELAELDVNEIFYSLQGEGARAGEPSVFVRLAGCDLTCGFCDTEFESHKSLNLKELKLEILMHDPCKWIVFTGGEPLLQLHFEVLEYFKDAGFLIAIETNGNNYVSESLRSVIDWLVVSPKVANHVITKNFKDATIDEYRLVRHKGHFRLSEPDDVTIINKYCSPIFDDNRPNQENIKHCIQLCLDQPDWKLSLQSHKILNIL
jgi:7-carboxy-7-deazaguanine synthase